jgi:hypothetical protein
MRSLALTVATVAVLALAFPQVPRVLAADDSDTLSGAGASRDGAASQTRMSDGESDKGGQSLSGRSESSEQSTGVKSKKSQARMRIGAKTGKTSIRGRSQTSVGLSSEPKQRVVIHKHSRGVVALSEPRRGAVIHQRGRGTFAFSGEPRRGVVIHKRGRGAVALSEPRRRVMIHGRQPGMTITGETRRHVNERSRQMMGSSATINRSARGRAGGVSGTTGQKGQSKPAGSREQ